LEKSYFGARSAHNGSAHVWLMSMAQACICLEKSYFGARSAHNGCARVWLMSMAQACAFTLGIHSEACAAWCAQNEVHRSVVHGVRTVHL